MENEEEKSKIIIDSVVDFQLSKKMNETLDRFLIYKKLTAHSNYSFYVQKEMTVEDYAYIKTILDKVIIDGYMKTVNLATKKPLAVCNDKYFSLVKNAIDVNFDTAQRAEYRIREYGVEFIHAEVYSVDCVNVHLDMINGVKNQQSSTLESDVLGRIVDFGLDKAANDLDKARVKNNKAIKSNR